MGMQACLAVRGLGLRVGAALPGMKQCGLPWVPAVRIGNNLSTAGINHQTNATVHKHQRQRATVKPFASVSVLVVRGKCEQAQAAAVEEQPGNNLQQPAGLRCGKFEHYFFTFCFVSLRFALGLVAGVAFVSSADGH